jgi:WD40 repeat protein
VTGILLKHWTVNYSVQSCAFIGSSRHQLAVCCRDGLLRLVDLEALKAPPRLLGSGSESPAIFTPDGSGIFAAHRQSGALAWDLRTALPRRVVGCKECPGVGTEHQRVTISQDCNWVAIAGGRGNQLHVHHTQSKTLLSLTADQGSEVRALAFSGGHFLAASISRHDLIHLWNLGAATAPLRLSAEKTSPEAICFSRDERLIAGTGQDGFAVAVWDTKSGAVVMHVRSPYCEYASPSLCFSPGSDLLFSGSGSSTAVVWDIRSSKEIQKLELGERWVDAVAVSRDGSRIGAQTRAGLVRIWQVEGFRLLSEFRGVVDLQAVVDGELNRVVEREGEAVFVDLRSGHPVAWLPSHTSGWSPHPSEPIWTALDGTHLQMVRLED